MCEQLQAPLLAGSEGHKSTSPLRPSPVLAVKQRSLDSAASGNSKAVPPTLPPPSTTEDSSQWSFIDSDATADGGASSISTLCSQFEATLAVNDCQLDSMLPADNDASKPTTAENS